MKWFIFLLIILPTMNANSHTFIRADTVDLNGTRTYYEVYGHSEPLLLFTRLYPVITIVKPIYP